MRTPMAQSPPGGIPGHRGAGGGASKRTNKPALRFFRVFCAVRSARCVCGPCAPARRDDGGAFFLPHKTAAWRVSDRSRAPPRRQTNGSFERAELNLVHPRGPPVRMHARPLDLRPPTSIRPSLRPSAPCLSLRVVSCFVSWPKPRSRWVSHHRCHHRAWQWHDAPAISTDECACERACHTFDDIITFLSLSKPQTAPEPLQIKRR